MDQIPLEIRASALEDMLAAVLWYSEHAPGREETLLVEIDRALNVVLEAPGRWALFESGTRRFILRKFPYSIIYRVSDVSVTVIAFSHHKREPGYWRE